MTIEEFVSNFAVQFNETGASEFKAETEFKMLVDWDSMTALSIIAMIDEEYDVAIKGDDIRNAATIEDLFKIVQAKNSHV